MDYHGLTSIEAGVPTVRLTMGFVIGSLLTLLSTAVAEPRVTSEPSTSGPPVVTNHSADLYPQPTPKSAKSYANKSENSDVLNLVNIQDDTNVYNFSKPSNPADDVKKFTAPSTAGKTAGLQAPSAFKEIQRTTAEIDDSPQEDSTSAENTDSVSEHRNASVHSGKTTSIPYSLDDEGIDIGYEVDISDVELLKTTEEPKRRKVDEDLDEGKSRKKENKDRKEKKRRKDRKNSRKSDGRGLSDEEALLEELFGDYNPSARPVIDSSSTVPVQIQFSLMHIKELNVINQVLTTTGLLILEWTDERLIWDPEEHNNMTEIIIEGKTLWRPEFAVINGAEKIYEDYTQFRAVISNKGRVHWEPGGVFKTMCEIDITYYPFDEQKCELTFGAWSYHTSKMNLTNSSGLINMDSYKLNGEWEIYSTVVKRNEFFYDCCPNERFANVAFALYMRRRHTFYVLNVILPSIMTSVLLLSVFFCTPGQKVQIGVVVLLSFRIFLLNVAGNIPKTSDHIPLLGIYLTCTMAITTLSMVLTVFVLNLHHVNDRPVPEWAKKIVLFYLARMMGMCSLAKQYVKERKRRKSSIARGLPPNSVLYRRPSPNHSVANDPEGDEQTTPIIELQTRTANGTPEINKSNHMTSGPSDHSHHQVAFPGLYRSKEKEEKEDYTKDWKKMAEVFDRLFFWLFLLAILISTLVLFHPLTNHYLQGHLLKRDS